MSDPIDAGTDSSSSSGDGATARPPFDPTPPAITCERTPCIQRLFAAERHYCAIDETGAAYCWGDRNALGDFGTGDDPNVTAKPVKLTGIAPAVDIAATSDRTCIIHADGSADCFGPSSPTPAPLAEVSNVKHLALSGQRSCAVKTNGDLFCFGMSWNWGTTDATMALGEKAVDSIVYVSGAIALGESGTLYSWGTDLRFMGRDSPYQTDLNPGPVQGLPPVLQFASADGNTLALGRDGRLFGWGTNGNGTLGLGTLAGGWTPTEVFFGTAEWPTQVAMATTHSCMRMSDDSVYCAGISNTYGHLGQESISGVYLPTMVPDLKSVAQVSTGFFSTCAIITDGSVQCWGDNSSGQLGLGAADQDRHWKPQTVTF